MKAKKSLLIVLFTILTASTAMAQIEGYWKGEMNVGVQKLETAFDIKAIENGYASTFDVPAQGAYDIPVDERYSKTDICNWRCRRWVPAI